MRERRMGAAARAIALMVLLAALFCGSGRAESASVRQIELNERLEVALSGTPARFSFTVPSNSAYTFASFGGEGVSAALSVGADMLPVASGDGFHFTERLVAGKRYTLSMTGTSGTAYVEIMRDALGRSFDKPLVIKNLGEGYPKAIARARDVHWYRFTPEATGLYMIATRGALSTEGLVTDASGRALQAVSNQVLPYDRNFALQMQLLKGQTYALRVCAKGDEVGRYTLRFIRAGSDAPVPSDIRLSAQGAKLSVGERVRLTASVEPDGALAELLWVSTDPHVATVTETGQVLALGAGTCEVIALGFGKAYATCKVEVRAVALTGISFAMPALKLPMGEQQPLAYAIEPANAKHEGVTFWSSDEKIAAVDGEGNLKALAAGACTVAVSTADGALSDQLEVTVTEQPPARRALVIGEARYVDGRVRIGAVNSAQGLADLLRAQSYGGATYEVTMRMDTSRGGAIQAIRDTFSGAKPGDVSLFAINCHGGYENGTPYLQFHDGTKLTAQGLELELRKIPGTVVVILDCCNSGAFISRMDRSQFTSRMLSAFGTDRSGSFAMSKYRVICSSSSTQQSYRISPKGIESEAHMSTALARALCLAGGWDIAQDKRTSMKADLDKDGSVTLEEVYQYAYKRVKLDLEEAADVQDVQIYPRGSQFVLFSRN